MRTILLILAFGVFGFVNAQTIEFSRIYTVWCEFSNNNFEQTSDGGYIFCSDAIPEMDTLAPTPLAYGYLVKLSSTGNPQWVKKFEKSDGTIKALDGNAVCETYDGGFIVATAYYTMDTATFSFRTFTYLIKTDQFGNHIWSRMYGGVGSSTPFCVTEAQNHDLLVCGSTVDSTNASMHGNFLMRTTSNGGLLWAKGFSPGSGFNSGELCSVIETASGDIVTCGNIVQQGLVMRLDAGGNILWSKYTSNVLNTDVAETPNGNLVMVGYTNNFSHTVYFEMDSAGAAINSFYYTTSPYNGASIVPTWDGVTIAGDGYTSGALLLHLSYSGNVLWNATYSDANGFLRPDLERTTDGGYAFAAQNVVQNSPSPYDWSVIVVKTDSTGNIPCHDSLAAFSKFPFPPPSVVNMNSINANTVFSKTTVLIPLLLHDSDMCVNEPDRIAEQQISTQISVFPNPAADVLNVQVNNVPGETVTFRICNADGRLLRCESAVSIGNYSGNISLAGLAAGLYILEIESDGVRLGRQKVIRE